MKKSVLLAVVHVITCTNVIHFATITLTATCVNICIYRIHSLQSNSNDHDEAMDTTCSSADNGIDASNDCDVIYIQ